MTTTFDASKIDAGKSPEQLCAEKVQRALDAIQLKQPDRIPISVGFGNLVADMAGITRQELAWDQEKSFQALAAAAQRFQPDFASAFQFSSPAMSKGLGDRMTKWPGYGLNENQSFQFNEAEYMKAEDYDAFLADPTDWAIRTYLPRAFKELEGLAMLPPLGMALYGYYGLASTLPALTIPPVASALQALNQAAQGQAQYMGTFMGNAQRLAALGFPMAPYGGLLAEAPFDFMSDTLRGMRGIFLDMRRNPEKLLAAEEKVCEIQMKYLISTCHALGMKGAFFPLHRGADGFISIEAFERFYWPQLKKMLVGLIDEGITPMVFWEGAWDQRLQYLAELPKGGTIGMFQQGDIFKVKEVLGDVMCIIGGMKVSMLAPGGATDEEIRAYTKRLCKEVGKGGGYIMSTDIGELEGCDLDKIKVWIDATREFGQY